MGRKSREKKERRETDQGESGAYLLTHEDLIEHLREQVELLQASSAAFDEGKPAHSKLIAITLRVMLHHTSQSKSVLELLGVQNSLAFVDTAGAINPRNLMTTNNLVAMQVQTGPGGGAKYVAMLGDQPPPKIGLPPKRFKAWWTEPVAKDDSGHTFSRKDFVLGLANKEGGGHIDPRLNEKYARLTRHNSLGWMYRAGTEPSVPLDSPVPSSVRQIAYEVLETVRSMPDLVDLF